MQLVAAGATRPRSRSSTSATPTPPSRSPTGCADGAAWPRTSPRRPSWRCGAAARATTARAAASARGCSGIVHNRAIDALRRPSSTTAAAPATRGSRSASRRASAPTSRRPGARRPPRCAAALDELPAEQCHVIELAYFGGFTHSEIAEMLDDADRDDQGPHAPRPGEAARQPRRAPEACRDRHGPDHARRPRRSAPTPSAR